MSREFVHVDVMSRACQGRRSTTTLVTTFRCKTYILYFIMSMLTLCQGRYILCICIYGSMSRLCQCIHMDTKLSCNGSRERGDMCMMYYSDHYKSELFVSSTTLKNLQNSKLYLFINLFNFL